VKGEPQERDCDEEAVHASVLADPAEPDAHLDGLLVRHTDTPDLAICQLRFDPNATFGGVQTTYWGLLSISATVLFLVLLIGRVYDATLGLWREHLTVVQERNPFTTYKLNAPFGILLAQTNAILRRMDPEDEEIQRHCDFVDRWLEWNSQEEIWARTMSSWKNIVGEEDPFLFHLDSDSHDKLSAAADELQDY